MAARTPADAAQGSRCAACGGTSLSPHLSVGGAAGSQGLVPTTDRYGTALADIVRCGRCGHMQLDRFPPDEELTAAYEVAESEAYVEEEVGQRATAAAVLDVVERYAKPGRLLDLGCWVGFLLAEARDRGWDGMGVEPSLFASGFARERLGLAVRTGGMFEADLPAASFDAVFMGDVIEHVIDPAGALELAGGRLTPGGVLAMTLPDAGSRVARVLGARWWSVIPTHVQYFTRNSMRTLLARGGWTVETITTAPKAFTVRYYLQRIAGYSPWLSDALVAAAVRLGRADGLWAPDFRDRMLVVARRRD